MAQVDWGAGVSGFCPHCGYNLENDKPLVVGALEIDPRGAVRWHGQEFQVTIGEHQILMSLANAAPSIVSRDALINRLGSEGADRIVDSHVKRLRRKFESTGHDAPIQSVYGRGYRWAA